MIILGYSIIQLPEFLRSCYLTISKYLRKRGETKETKSNKIEVEKIHIDQTNTTNEQQLVNAEKLNFSNYVNLKIQLIRNLQEFTTTGDEKYVKKSEMWEMFMQRLIY